MLEGSCHCGRVRWAWHHAALPEGATAWLLQPGQPKSRVHPWDGWLCAKVLKR